MSRSDARVLALAAAVSLLTAACSGVPQSSPPQVVGPVAGGQASAAPAVAPEPGADQRTIVTGFLAANASDDARHTAARAFLTPDAKNRWIDSTVTVIQSETVSTFDPADATITVTGQRIGTVNPDGTYSPDVKGDGSTGGDTLSFDFVLRKVEGEWRIDTLKNGLILTSAQFKAAFKPQSVFFFDSTESRLVPDPRFTFLTVQYDRNLLADWLLAQLVGGPRQELRNAVTTELPAQTDPHNVSVTIGSVTSVEIPGAGQLDAPTRSHLAAQLADTLSPVTGTNQITVTDGGRPVAIPSVGTRFSWADFSWADVPAPNALPVYYVRSGVVVDEDGRPLAGPLGAPGYGLTSVAVAGDGTGDLRVAGTRGSQPNAVLLVGSRGRGLRETQVRGALSRPAWAPRLDEAWVGAGSSIYRATSAGLVSVVSVTAPGGKLAGRVSALRFSRDGVRIAMVLAAPDGSAQVWVGAVVRSPGQVRVDSLEPISPLGIVAVDVAWNDQLKLFMIGHDANSYYNEFEMQADGALWTPKNTTNLPGIVDSITVAENLPAWVSAGGSVFVQHGTSWANPGLEATAGSNPVYLE